MTPRAPTPSRSRRASMIRSEDVLTLFLFMEFWFKEGRELKSVSEKREGRKNERRRQSFFFFFFSSLLFALSRFLSRPQPTHHTWRFLPRAIWSRISAEISRPFPTPVPSPHMNPARSPGSSSRLGGRRCRCLLAQSATPSACACEIFPREMNSPSESSIG